MWPEYGVGDYGNQQIEELTEHYSDVVDQQATLQEWGCFVNVVQNSDNLKGKDSHEMLKAIVQQQSLHDIFPNLYKLAAIALVIPVSSADCERGFSTLKRVKTKLRNRLSNRILNHLLTVSIEGPRRQDFDFQRAADIWAAQKSRKVNVSS